MTLLAKLPADAQITGSKTKPLVGNTAMVATVPVSGLLADATHVIVG